MIFCLGHNIVEVISGFTFLRNTEKILSVLSSYESTAIDFISKLCSDIHFNKNADLCIHVGASSNNSLNIYIISICAGLGKFTISSYEKGNVNYS